MINYALKTIIILATFQFSRISSTCPSKCSCENNTITCIAKELQDIPIFETIDIDPVVIDLSGNKLISIDIYDFSFEKNAGIKEIYLNYSAITDIEDRCFDELVSLQELYLNNNNLKSVPKNLISENANMIVLDMSNNIFEKFPVLNSSSLEVYALANAGITYIPEESLRLLSNLRLLLLQENKLKQLSPTIFNNLRESFFVKLTYNLWNCSCDTVKIFQFLTARGYTEITQEEPIQCLSKDKNFIDIYYSNGTTWYYHEKCYNNVSIDHHTFKNFKPAKLLLEDTKQEEYLSTKNEVNQTNTKESTVGSTITPPTGTSDSTLEADIDISSTQRVSFKPYVMKSKENHTMTGRILNSCGSDEFYGFMKIVLLITVPVAFLLGMLFGCYLAYVYRKSSNKTRITDSSKRLLSPSIEEVVKEECA